MAYHFAALQRNAFASTDITPALQEMIGIESMSSPKGVQILWFAFDYFNNLCHISEDSFMPTIFSHS
jgi:hypothetical protein